MPHRPHWEALTSRLFTGAAATVANGATGPSISTAGGHWAAGTPSTVSGVAQEAVMESQSRDWYAQAIH